MILGQVIQISPDTPGYTNTGEVASSLGLISLSNDGKVPVIVQMVLARDDEYRLPLEVISAGNTRLVYQWSLEPGEFTSLSSMEFPFSYFDSLEDTSAVLALVVIPKRGSGAVVGYRVRSTSG